MTEKELRIGGLFYYENIEDNIEIVSFNSREILSKYGVGGLCDGLYYHIDSLNEISPIPITEKWLEMFGFEKQKDQFYRIENTYIEILFHDSGFLVALDSVNKDHIKHVHQLQNLYFALTGKELELK